MKTLNNFITEKFKINSKNAPKKIFNHKNKKDIKPFWGYNWLLNNDYFDDCYELLDFALDNLSLTDNEEEFIIDFEKDIDDYNDNFLRTGNNDRIKKTEIINGKTNNGYYPRVKCIYDICKYINDNKDIKNKSIKDIAEKIIFDINNISDNKINNLDWAYNEKD